MGTRCKTWKARTKTGFSMAVGMLTLWIVLMLPVVLTVSILLPSAVYDLRVFANIATTLTIAITAVSVIGNRWGQRRPESELYVLGLAAGGLFTLLAAVTISRFFL